MTSPNFMVISLQLEKLHKGKAPLADPDFKKPDLFRVKLNTNHFIEFTNCNLSQRLVELNLTIFVNNVEEHDFNSK